MKRVSVATAIACLLAACGGSASGGPATSSAPSPSDAALHAHSVQFERAYEQTWHVSKGVADCVMAYEHANQSQGAIAKGLTVDPRHVLGQIDCTKP